MIERIAHYPRRDGPLPLGAKWVGRPSRYGNPYTVTDERTAAEAVDRYRPWLAQQMRRNYRFLYPLTDATALACACPLGQPCHGDVLTDALNALLLRSPQEQPTNQQGDTQ